MSGTTNAAKLHNTLVSWQQNNKDANLKVIKHALRKSIVGMASLADHLDEVFIEELKTMIPRQPHSNFNAEMESLSINAKVSDGKSTLLGIEFPHSQQVSYRWKKNGIILSDNSYYSGVHSDILFIREACQGIEGKYTCTICCRGRKKQIEE